MYIQLNSNPKLDIDISYSNIKFGVNRSKQAKVQLLSGNWISIFSNSELDLVHRQHLGSNPTLPLDIGYPQTKNGINWYKQTKDIDRKPRVAARPPARRLQHYNNQFSVKT